MKVIESRTIFFVIMVLLSNYNQSRQNSSRWFMMLLFMWTIEAATRSSSRRYIVYGEKQNYRTTVTGLEPTAT